MGKNVDRVFYHLGRGGAGQSLTTAWIHALFAGLHGYIDMSELETCLSTVRVCYNKQFQNVQLCGHITDSMSIERLQPHAADTEYEWLNMYVFVFSC
jgi:hypothetical protein